MNDLKNPFAKDENGKIVYINNASNYNTNILKQKKFTCVECNKRLIPRMGEKNRWHFAHQTEEDSSNRISNCSGNIESALHQYAKEVIKKSNYIVLPELSINECQEMHCGREIFEGKYKEYLAKDKGNAKHLNKSVFTSDRYKYTWLENEKRIYNYIPDCLCDINGKMLAIEILVTHAVDDIKTKKVFESEIDTIEIDLTLVEIEMLENRNFNLDEYILKEAPRKWIYKSYIDEFDKIIKYIIHNEGFFIYDKNYTKKQSLIELKKREREKLKQENPQEFYKRIKKKNIRNIPNIIQEYLNIKQERQLEICNIPVKGEYAFKCPRKVWQTEIFNKFILNRRGKTVQIAKINSYVDKYSKLLYFKEFDYNDDYIWKSKYDAIRHYIIKLISIGALRELTVYDDITHWTEIEILCDDRKLLNDKLKETKYEYNNICVNCGEIYEENSEDRYYLFQFNRDKDCFLEYVEEKYNAL